MCPRRNNQTKACTDVGLTISIIKPNITSTNSHRCQPVKLHLGSVISDVLSLDAEQKQKNKRIGKATATLSRLSKRVWNNRLLTKKTKIKVYKACVLSTLLCASDTQTLKSHTEKKTAYLSQQNLRRIPKLNWKDKMPNKKILKLAEI